MYGGRGDRLPDGDRASEEPKAGELGRDSMGEFGAEGGPRLGRAAERLAVVAGPVVEPAPKPRVMTLPLNGPAASLSLAVFFVGDVAVVSAMAPANDLAGRSASAADGSPLEVSASS